MRRFYCVRCNRIKRVRSLPANIIGEPGSMSGECRWHDAPSHRQSLLRDRKPKASKIKAVKITAAPTPKKARKQRDRTADESAA